MSARKYKHPPIEEALCEFTFPPRAQGQQFDLTLPGRLQVQDSMKEYSGQARTQNIQTIATAENTGQIAVQRTLISIELPMADGTRLISVGANTLAISVLRPYDGWQNFRPRIEQALEAFTENNNSVVRGESWRQICQSDSNSQD